MATVLGLDLSLTATGLAHVQDGRLWDTERVRTTGKKGDNLAARADRLHRAGEEIVEWVIGDSGDEPADLIVIESPAYGAKFGSPHDRSGLWWLVVNHLIRHGLPVATVAPMTRAKYGTGRGNARKGEVLEAVRLRFPEAHAQGAIPDDNVADAILLATLGSRRIGEPVEVEPLTAKMLEAVAKVEMP